MRCGAAFRPPQLTSHVGCPYCAHIQALDAATLRELQGYERRVGDQLVAAEKHAQHRATYEKWYGTAEKRRNHTAEFFITAAICAVIAGIIGALLASAGIVEWMMMPTIVLMGGFMSGALVVYGRMFVSMFRKVEVERGKLDEVWVACPTCGAPGMLTPGDAIDTCAHCHAALVPGKTAIQQGLDAAARARRDAALQHYRTELETFARLYSSSGGKHVVFFVLVPFGVMIGVPTVILTFEQLQQGRALPLGPALVLYGICFGLWGTILLLVYMRWTTAQAIERGFAPLEQQYGARRAQGTRPLADWLLAHWAGPYPTQRLYTGTNHQIVEGRCRGFAFLIDFNPSRAEHMVTRATLLIAAQVPGVEPLSIEHQSLMHDLGIHLPHGNQTSRDLRFRLQHAGFDLRLSEAGLSASATEPLLGALRKHPERLAEWTSVVSQAIDLVIALGGRPG